MDVIPAIDIRGGRCVRLVQGDYARETVFADDPAEAAKRWRDAGARRLHVVDLDGARQGRPLNWEAVTRIVAAVDAPVQMGGGLRDLGTVQRYLDGGIERVVLGTAAVKDEALLGAALDRFPGRIVVGVDARDGIVVTEGWLEASGVAAGELVRRLAAMGVPRIIYTDTLRDGTLTEPNFPGLQALLADVQSSGGEMRVLYSGGVASLRHVRRLAETGVEGVVVGRALYTGDVDLRDAIAAAQA